MSASHIRILHLEDRTSDAELIHRELSRAKLSFSATRVETEQALRDALESSDHDVILADYNLPGFDGMTALRIARELVPETPFIFVSGSIGEERAIQALREGACDYIIKDRPARLPAAIIRALDERRQRLHRSAAEEALKRSDDLYKHAASATQEIILDWNLRSDKVTFNEAFDSIWGYEIDGPEISIDWVFDKIHPEERESIERSKRKAIEHAGRWEGSFRFRLKDGLYAHVLERAVVIRDKEGQPARVICAMLDVTHQKAAQELMLKAERRFRALAEAASDAIIISDAAGRIVFINGVGQADFGYSTDEVAGQPIDMLLPQRDRAAYRLRLQETLASPRGIGGGNRQVTGLRKDGGEFAVDVELSTWEHDGEIFVTSAMRDATERVGFERCQRIELAVARVLFDAASALTGITRLLEEIGTELGWKVGFFWTLPDGGETLHCDGIWFDEGFDGAEFADVSCKQDLQFGEGIPGEVWQMEKPLVVGDPSGYPSNLRAASAVRAGLRSGLAFPIFEASGVTGVMEFYDTAALRPHDEPLITALKDIGQRIGEFLQRGRAEDQVKSREMDLANAQRIARLGSYSLHVPTGTVQWSDETFHIFGMLPGDVVPTITGYLERVHRDDRSRVQRIITPPYRSETVQFEHRVVGRDQSQRIVSCVIRTMEGTAAKPIKVLGTIQDITERVEAQEMILSLNRENRAILDSAAQGIIGTGTDGKATFSNPAAVAMTGFSSAELRDASALHKLLRFSDLNGAPLPIDHSPLLLTLMDGAMRKGIAAIRKKSGEMMPILYAASPMVIDGDHAGAVLTFADITERLAMEGKLEQANRVSSLGRVAATIAHEFNNVLMGIQPFAEVIHKRSADDERTRSASSQILTSVKRGKRVTEEILRFAQPSPPALTTTVVSEWLAGVLPELSGMASKRIPVRLDLPAEPVTCGFDRAQMHQVITNLVLNARDAIAGEGSIVISLDAHPEKKAWPFGSVPSGMVVLSVADTGGGMPPAVMANIFEPLFTTKRHGTGLGLAVVHQILGSHGGSIHVDSRPGTGTTFYMVLPRASSVVEPAAELRAASASIIRDVLLVEDEEIVAAGITALFEMEGIAVRTVYFGAGVAPSIELRRPDLVLLDVSLPDMTGFEVYADIANRWPSLPVIFSTGHADESELEKMARPRNVGFLRKPYDHETLLRAIESVVSSDEVVH